MPAESLIRVICVDDHVVVLRGISAILAQEPDIDLVACASTAQEGINHFVRHKPDVTLMDLQFPDLSGFDAIRTIRKANSNARIIVLTMHQTSEDIHRALEAGAAAYLLKDTLADNLIRVIREVHAGGRPLEEIDSALHQDEPALSPREVQVLRLIAQGMRNKEIGVALGISDETVHTHLRTIFTKLKVHDRTLALAVAVRRGIVRLT